mmetsp:Transcript_1967/g.5926  ORF Transcript_1967/g.5926 Transcript_1967/m.5926 type:complete len:205 (+) Transcript_1967:3372-3986(+)
MHGGTWEVLLRGEQQPRRDPLPSWELLRRRIRKQGGLRSSCGNVLPAGSSGAGRNLAMPSWTLLPGLPVRSPVLLGSTWILLRRGIFFGVRDYLSCRTMVCRGRRRQGRLQGCSWIILSARELAGARDHMPGWILLYWWHGRQDALHGPSRNFLCNWLVQCQRAELLSGLLVPWRLGQPDCMHSPGRVLLPSWQRCWSQRRPLP